MNIEKMLPRVELQECIYICKMVVVATKMLQLQVDTFIN